MNVTQAVILAGGKGERLRPLTNDRPKPMVLVNGKPFLENLTDLLREHGITDIVLLLGYLPEKVTEYFGDGKKFGVHIRYSITDVENDTGTRLKKAEALLDDHFFLMYGDNYWPIPFGDIVDFYSQKNVLGLMTVYNNRDGGGEYGWKNNVRVEPDGKVLYYGKASDDPAINAIDIGTFLLSKKVVDLLPADENISFQTMALPQLIEQGQLAAYRVDHPYYPLTSPAHVSIAEKFLSHKKVIFLDRDGVINRNMPEHGYVTRPEEFEFLPGALDALRDLTQAGYDIYIVTNQRGISRGLMTTDDLMRTHRHMIEEVNKAGGRISGIYFCPHGNEDGCLCRKPKAGMFFQAAREHHIDLTKAIFNGDSESDRVAGQAAGCGAIIIEKDGSLYDAIQSLLKPHV